MKEYSIKEAAEILEVSTSTVRRRIKSGKLAAEKKKTSYGQQYFIPAKELDRAVTDKEVVDIQEVSKPISQEELKKTLIEAVGNKQKALIEGITNSINQKVDEQHQSIKALNKQNKQDKEEIIEKLDKQQQVIEKQSQMIRQLQEEKNKSLLEKIKELFT